MADKNTIKVEVAYALPDEQVIIPIEVEAGTTAEQAIILSDILSSYPEIDIARDNKIGIFGKLSKAATELRNGDRVEIYRPLIADPKEVRRRRAAEGKRMSKGGGSLDDESNQAPAASD